jgi:hypothetical protein
MLVRLRARAAINPMIVPIISEIENTKKKVDTP